MLTKVTRASRFRTSHRSEGVCCLRVMKWCRWFKSSSTLSNGSVDTLVLPLSVSILFEHCRMIWWICTDKCSHSCSIAVWPTRLFVVLVWPRWTDIHCYLCFTVILWGALSHSVPVRSRHLNCEDIMVHLNLRKQYYHGIRSAVLCYVTSYSRCPY
jgi:hypothetical protein